MPRIPKRVGTYVTAMINDGGTCLAPAVVLRHAADGKRAELLISTSNGFRIESFRIDSDYVGRPSAEYGESFRQSYPLLAERAEFMLTLDGLPDDIATVALAAWDALPICRTHGIAACAEKECDNVITSNEGDPLLTN